MTRPSFTRPRPTSSFESVNCSVTCWQTAPLYSTFSRHCVFWMSLTTLSTASARASSCGWGHHKSMSHIHPSIKTRFHFYTLPSTQTLTIPHTIDRHFKVLSVCSEPIRLHRSNSAAAELLIHHTYTHKRCDYDKCKFANKKQIKIPPHQHNVSQMFDARGERYRSDLSLSYTHTLCSCEPTQSPWQPQSMFPLGGVMVGVQNTEAIQNERKRQRTMRLPQKMDKITKQQQYSQGRWHDATPTHKRTPTQAQSSSAHRPGGKL